VFGFCRSYFSYFTAHSEERDITHSLDNVSFSCRRDGFFCPFHSEKGLIVLEILSWTAMLCSFGGNILINLKIVWGFPVWIISNYEAV